MCFNSPARPPFVEVWQVFFSKPDGKIPFLSGLILILFFLTGAGNPDAGKVENPWRQLDSGLFLGEFPGPGEPMPGTERSLKILRIDPKHHEFRLLNATHPQGTGKPMSTRQWALRHNLVAAINASMYQRDNRTSVSFMKSGGHVNNTWFSKDKALLAFDPESEVLPPVQILDRDCQNVKRLRKEYQSLVQSIRMVSCKRENVWAQQPGKRWSVAAIGEDRRGRILFIHSRTPSTVHDLIDHLLALKPVELKRAMYVEGGPEAQLFIRSGKEEMEFVGTYRNSDPGAPGNTIAWPIPNVVGIVKKEAP